MSHKRWVAWSVGLSLAAVAVGCSIAVRRDLSAVPPGQVGFDDMCGLQEYFDALEIHTTPPPRVVSALDLEAAAADGGRPARGGRERFAFENDFQLKHLRRVLGENWRRIPPQVERAVAVEIEVKWSEKAGVKRVVTDQEAEIAVGPESWSLPYQVCLSELLYGEPLYRQRRVMWGLPLPGRPAAASPVGAAGTGVAGAGDGGVGDAGREPRTPDAASGG